MKGLRVMNLINAFGLLNMINEGGAEYLEKNKHYVEEHRENVKQFADWLVEKVPDLFTAVDIESFYEIIDEHDESKFSEEEFEPYAQKWFGDGKKTPAYNAAWKHHWTHNEHHPEFWLGEDMPYIYILEMLCDWGSFSIKSGDFRELSKFYYDKARDDEEKNLSDNTKKIIEDSLDLINAAIDKEV